MKEKNYTDILKDCVKIADIRQAQDRHGVYDGCKIRRLTPKECERLQGFPDDWTKQGLITKEERKDYEFGVVEISDTQRYKMCGNAVTVNVVKEIMKRLLINYYKL